MKAIPIHWYNLLALTLCLVLGAGCKGHQAKSLLSAANADFKVQKYDKAEIEYLSVLRVSPVNPEAIRQLGLIYFEEGRPDSFKYLKKSNELEPKNTEVQLKLAEIYVNGKKNTEANDLLGKVLQSEPANEQALRLLVDLSRANTNALASLSQRLETQLREGGQGAAALHSVLGSIDLYLMKTNDALTELQKALTLDSKLVSPYLGKAMLCYMQNDTKGLEQALKTAAELSPIRSSTRLKYVDYEMQTGAADKAKEMLQEITTKAPDYLPAWLSLARIDLGERKFDDCKAALDKVLERDSFNFEATLQLGTMALAQRNVSQALNTFQRLDSEYGGIPEVKYHLALAHVLNNEKQKAIANLNAALALKRDYTPAMFLLAELDFRSGNLTEAVGLLSQLMKNHPESAQAGLMLAEAYLAQNQPSRALEVYQRMAQIFPKNPEIPRRVGMVYWREGDPAQARASFEKSLDLDLNYLPTLQQITGMDISQGRFAEAHRRVDGVMEKNPKAAEPLVLQGDIYKYEGQTNKAESAYSKAIELDPDQPAAYLSLAQLYWDSHQEQQALKRLNALLEKTNSISAMMMIGVIHRTAGQYEQACDAYEKILLKDPKNVRAMNDLAYVDAEFMGKPDQALKLAETARQLVPYDPYTADTLGWILYKKHEYARALSLIQESAEKQPDDPEVQMHLGLAYYMMEEEKPARLSLERALAGHDEFPGKEMARRRLEILNIEPSNATPAMVEKLQALVHDDPLDPVPLSRLASIQEQRGEVQAAVESLQKLLKINPQDWPAMIRLARLYADHLHDFNQALELAKSARKLAPDDSHASALLGELIYRSGDYSWAASLLEQAANQPSDQPSLFYHLALAYYAVGRVADADAAMQRAVQTGDSQPYLDQAKQFLAMRAAIKDPAQTQASAAQARQILDKDPNYVPALMVSARLAESRSTPDEAEQICQKVLSIYPLFVPAMRELAILYSHSQSAGDKDKAYELGQKARAAMPDDFELAKTLGILAYDRHDYNRSMLLLQENAEKSGHDGEALYYLGMDYYQLKQPTQCKQALRRALELHLSDQLAALAQSTLGQLK